MIYLIGYLILAVLTFVFLWPMLKVAAQADCEMEEMRQRRKMAEIESKLDE